jgi:outer membrane protein assembly factor BamA
MQQDMAPRVNRVSILIKVIVIATFFIYLPVQASDTIYLQDIVVNGNVRTYKTVIITELGFRSKKQVSLRQIEEGISNLRNTNLFSKVEYNLQDGTEGKVLIIDLDERWTTIPILKFSSGGGVSQTTLGVYDPNLFGKYIEAGFQYERLEDTNSGVAWFKQPHLFGRRKGIDIQVWKIDRLRTKYVQDTEEPVIKTGFLHSREKIYLAYDRMLSGHFKGHFFYEYNNDSFSDEFTSDEVKAIIAASGLPPSSRVHFLGASLDVGRINQYNSQVEGSSLAASYRYALSDTSNISDFWQSDVAFKYFKTLYSNATFAQRLLAGFTTTDVLQYWYYLGGLDRIRGFSDNRFAGRYFWLSNTEYRQPTWQKDWFVLQAIGFLDIVSSSEHFSQLGTIDGASAGIGLRVILPKIYRFALRLDYAHPIKKSDDMNFSFGVQQFF